MREDLRALLQDLQQNTDVDAVRITSITDLNDFFQSDADSDSIYLWAKKNKRQDILDIIYKNAISKSLNLPAENLQLSVLERQVYEIVCRYYSLYPKSTPPPDAAKLCWALACNQPYTTLIAFLPEELTQDDLNMWFYIAVAYGHVEGVEALIRRNANILSFRINNKSILSTAIHNGNTEIIRILLSNQVVCQSDKFSDFINEAADWNQAEVVKVLLASLNFTILSEEDKKRCLDSGIDRAAGSRFVDVLKILLARPEVELTKKLLSVALHATEYTIKRMLAIKLLELGSLLGGADFLQPALENKDFALAKKILDCQQGPLDKFAEINWSALGWDYTYFADALLEENSENDLLGLILKNGATILSLLNDCQPIKNIINARLNEKPIVKELLIYILQRSQEDMHLSSLSICGLWYKPLGFSKKEKLAAAYAFRSVLLHNEDPKILDRHSSVLNNGRLGKIYERYSTQQKIENGV